MPNRAAKACTYPSIASALGSQDESSTPPAGVSGWSSYPTHSKSSSSSSSSLTRLLRSATKQNGQTKSEKSLSTGAILGP